MNHDNMVSKAFDYSLQSHNTMNVAVNTHCFISIQSVAELQHLLKTNDYIEPLYILGGGSNVLFLQDYQGTVLNIQIKGKEIVKETDDEVWLKAYAGENWHEFVLYTLDKNYGGLENLSLIPGRVGASPMQNIGAYGVEIKDTFHSLEAIEIATGVKRIFDYDACEFGYRESIFKNKLKNKFIITSVTFQLRKRNHQLRTSYGAIQNQLDDWGIENPNIQDISRAVVSIRQSKLPDPKRTPNSGSFFKNPTVDNAIYEKLKTTYSEMPGYPVSDTLTKIPAGWLIEKAGWKGHKTPTVGVHPKQALVLINHTNGSGQDIYDLSEKILQDVYKKFGIKLEREVNVIN